MKIELNKKDIIEAIIFTIIFSIFYISWCYINSNTTNNKLLCEKCKDGKLAYVDTINYNNGTTFYRYECNNCGRLFRTEKWRGK